MVMAISSTDLHWAAGFIDGEGTLSKNRVTISISADQKDEWHILKLQSILGGKTYSYTKPDGRSYNRWYAYADEAVVIMRLLYNLLSPRRQTRLLECLEKRKSLKPYSWHNTAKTHCKRGHTLEGDNLYLKPNGAGRECKTCGKIARDKYYNKLKDKG
jgi:hypothetical protein